MENKTLKELYREMNPDIYHYGVLGMHWGVRRFQPYSLIPRKSGEGGKEVGAAKKASKASSASSAIKKTINKPVSAIQKKTRKQKSEEAKEEVEKKVTTARQRREELEKIVRSGDAKLVYEHRSELSKQQLDAAIERINTEAKVASLVRQQNPTTLDKVKQFADKVDDVNSIVKTGLNTERNIADIKKIAKDAKAARKAEASSKALKDIIDNGATAEEVYKRQSELSDKDLRSAVERVKNLKQDKDVLNKDNKHASDMQKKAENEFSDYKKDLSGELDKYGEAYTRKKYSDDYSKTAIDSILKDREQAKLDEQAANRYEQQKKYNELQDKRKRNKDYSPDYDTKMGYWSTKDTKKKK